MKRISEEILNSIVSLLDSGFTSREIQSKTGVSRSSVDRVRNRTRPGVQKNRGGRPSKRRSYRQAKISPDDHLGKGRYCHTTYKGVGKRYRRDRQPSDRAPCTERYWYEGCGGGKKSLGFYQDISACALTSHSGTGTGRWRTGNGLFGQMKQK